MRILTISDWSCKPTNDLGARNQEYSLFVLFITAVRYSPSVMTDSFTHEVGDDPVPRRRVRISGPVYDDGSVPLLRIEYEDGNAELVPTSDMRLFRPLQQQRRNPPLCGLRCGLRGRRRGLSGESCRSASGRKSRQT